MKTLTPEANYALRFINQTETSLTESRKPRKNNTTLKK
jgi:hypothetical protein